MYACSYDPETRVTCGLLLGTKDVILGKLSDDQVPDRTRPIWDSILHDFSLAWHPMLIPLTLIDMSTETFGYRSAELASRRDTLEHQLGMGCDSSPDATVVDLVGVAKYANENITFFSDFHRSLLSCQGLLSDISDLARLVQLTSKGYVSGPFAQLVGQRLREGQADLSIKLWYSTSLNKDFLLWVANDKERMQSVVSLVRNN